MTFRLTILGFTVSSMLLLGLYSLIFCLGIFEVITVIWCSVKSKHDIRARKRRKVKKDRRGLKDNLKKLQYEENENKLLKILIIKNARL